MTVRPPGCSIPTDRSRVIAMDSAFNVQGEPKPGCCRGRVYRGVLSARCIDEHRPCESLSVDYGAAPAGVAITRLWCLEALAIPAAVVGVDTVHLGDGVGVQTNTDANAAVVADASKSDAVAIVVIGSGNTFFAGGFFRQRSKPDPPRLRTAFVGFLEMFETTRNAPQPVIVVNGVAAGGGGELIVACDLTIAVEFARLEHTGVRMASASILGGTNLVAISIGEERAKEVSFLCRQFSAQEALGLSAVVHDDEPESAVEVMVAELTRMSRPTWKSPSSRQTCGGMPAATSTRTRSKCSCRPLNHLTCATGPRHSRKSILPDSRGEELLDDAADL